MFPVLMFRRRLALISAFARARKHTRIHTHARTRPHSPASASAPACPPACTPARAYARTCVRTRKCTRARTHTPRVAMCFSSCSIVIKLGGINAERHTNQHRTSYKPAQNVIQINTERDTNQHRTSRSYENVGCFITGDKLMLNNQHLVIN